MRIGNDEFGCPFDRLFNRRARDGRIILLDRSVTRPPSRQSKRAILFGQEHEAAFDLGQLQRNLDQRHQNFVDGPKLVQRTRGIQEPSQPL